MKRARRADPYRDTEVIDERAPRVNQAVVGLVALLAVVTGWWWLLALLALQLALGLTLGRRWCVACVLYFEVLQPRLGEGRLEDARPPRFANLVGLAVLTAASARLRRRLDAGRRGAGPARRRPGAPRRGDRLLRRLHGVPDRVPADRQAVRLLPAPAAPARRLGPGLGLRPGRQRVGPAAHEPHHRRGDRGDRRPRSHRRGRSRRRRAGRRA